MRLAPCLVSLVFLLGSRLAVAQAPAPGAPPTSIAPPTAGTAAGAPAAVPPLPAVDDPMLAPVPPPAHVISSWAEALQLLSTRSTNLRTALDQVLQAEGQTMVALAQYLPSLGGCAGGSSAPPGCANASFAHQIITHSTLQNVTGEPTSTIVPIPNTLVASMTLSQDLLNMQEYDQIGINKLMEDSSRLTVEDTRRTLALSLATQIVSVITAERSAEINRVGLRTALEQLDLTRRRANLGAAMLLDVVRADQNAENARVALVSGDEALRQARESLGLILGIPEETGVSHDVNVDGLTQAAMRDCRPVATVDERPDMLAAAENVDVAKRNLRNTWYSFIPVVTLQSTLSATSAVNAGYPNPTWSIGAALSVPIFDGGTRLGTIKSQRAAQDLAEQARIALERQDLIQVEQAQRGVVVAQDSYDVALRQRDLAAQNDTLTQALWSHGQGTSVDLVTASEAHRQAEQSLVIAEFGMVKARLAAVMALATCSG
jgi:outer membrane protein, multidrug efflux system